MGCCPPTPWLSPVEASYYGCRCDEIPVELFQKMMLWKCCTQYAIRFGKFSNGPRTRKGQFSFPSQRKTMPKNAQATTQLHSSHMLVKWCLKFSKPYILSKAFSASIEIKKIILQARLQQYVNCELPDVQAGFRKGRGTRDQIANISWIIEKQESSRETSISALLTMPKPLTVWITINCGNSSRDGSTRSPELPLEKSICRSGSNS